MARSVYWILYWHFSLRIVFALEGTILQSCFLLSLEHRQMEIYRFITQIIRSWIHERTISLRFLCIILRVLRLEVPYTMFTLQTSFKPLLLKGRGEKNLLVEVTVNSKEETHKTFVQLRSRTRPQNSFSKQISWAGTKLAKFNISLYLNVFYINAIVYKLHAIILQTTKTYRIPINFLECSITWLFKNCSNTVLVILYL